MNGLQVQLTNPYKFTIVSLPVGLSVTQDMVHEKLNYFLHPSEVASSPPYKAAIFPSAAWQ